MRNRTRTLILLAVMLALILDSRCGAESARGALALCASTLIPALFPLFVISAMLVPGLKSIRVPFLSRLIGIPEGSEGIFLLGCAGGFPVGAACIAQAVEEKALSRKDAERMLGICNFCGPSFLFGVIAAVLSLEESILLFLIQLETALVIAAFWPNPSREHYTPASETVRIPDAVGRSISSTLSVCAWVVLAAIAAGFLRRWLFPLLPGAIAAALTGLLELTNGIFALNALPQPYPFVYSAIFISFGGVSVLLQIAGLASRASLSMKPCIAQKLLQGILSALLALLVTHLGPIAFFLPLALLGAKIAVEISGSMVYNTMRKEGI